MDWIEFVSGWNPDLHNGSVEWLIVVGLFFVTVVMFALAVTEWRRAPVESSGSRRTSLLRQGRVQIQGSDFAPKVRFIECQPESGWMREMREVSARALGVFRHVIR